MKAVNMLTGSSVALVPGRNVAYLDDETYGIFNGEGMVRASMYK